ncbi:anthranilate phosphoribosyltransferase, partial [Pseudomonas aeruginosa]
DADMMLVQKALDEIGLCFLMAQRHHGSMRHVGPTRVELGTRTIFNLVGPLANPAGTRRLMMGVFARDWVEPIAYAQRNLGAERAWVVHGLDGLDEL